MKKQVRIAYSSLPVRLPTTTVIAIWLLLDRLQVSDVVMGAVMTLLGLIWLCALVAYLTQRTVDVSGYGERSVSVFDKRD